NMTKLVISKGYTPITRVLVKDGEELKDEYIKASDPLGRDVFIKLGDYDNSGNARSYDVTADFIPYGYKDLPPISLENNGGDISMSCTAGACTPIKSSTSAAASANLQTIDNETARTEVISI